LLEPDPTGQNLDGLPYLLDAKGERIADQFRLTLNGVGGDSVLAGFYLDDLMVRTMEGGLDDDSPDHFHFLHAPVLVGDITVKDPTKADGDPDQFLTLDGIFGMNFLIASGLIDSADDSNGGLPSTIAPGAFDWVTVDFTNPNFGVLGLQESAAVATPEPASLGALALAVPALLARRRRR
jgi:hypothetical protein